MVVFAEKAALEIEKAKEEKAEILPSLMVDALGGKRYSSLGFLGNSAGAMERENVGEV